MFKLTGSVQECDLLCLTAGTNSLTGTAEMLGPFHQNPTDVRQEEPHFHVGIGTEQQNRDTIGQGEINETEAAWGNW